MGLMTLSWLTLPRMMAISVALTQFRHDLDIGFATPFYKIEYDGFAISASASFVFKETLIKLIPFMGQQAPPQGC
jgi:hypothetical protein